MSHDEPAAYLALPAAALPPPRRQLLVGTALACLAGSTLIGAIITIGAGASSGSVTAPTSARAVRPNAPRPLRTSGVSAGFTVAAYATVAA